jgi:hypothetical protein
MATTTNQTNALKPDPTLLTTQQLLREIGLLREVLESRMSEMSNASLLRHKILETRLDGMDKAIQLLQNLHDKFPTSVDEKISALKEIHEEKFGSVQTQFRERDVRTEQSSKDSKVAVDAALQAAKEAVSEQNKSSALAIAKSEAATTKQIDLLGTQIQTGNKAVDDKFDDIKERLTRIEGKDEGSIKTVKELQTNTGMVIAISAAIISAIIGIAGLIIGFIRPH